MDWIQRRATRMIKGLKHLSCEEKLRKLELFGPENLGRSSGLEDVGRPLSSLPVFNGSLQERWREKYSTGV